MTLHYDLLLPQRIVFGWGRRTELPTLAAELGRRAWLVAGSRTLERNGTLARLQQSLHEQGIAAEVVAQITHEPEVADVDTLVEQCRSRGVAEGDCFIAIGGGSAIDLAKAASALLTQGERASVRDYLEGVGRGWTIERDPLPLLAMPTTGGTGTEATKNAVISSYDPPFKKSIRSPKMVPRVVLVDPELSVSVPATTTAYTGLDAITQLIESYLCRSAKPVPQALAVDGLRRALPSVVEAVRNGGSRTAREALAHAALLSGIALANSGLGLAHGVAAALGSVCRVPHGLACAVMLPVALDVNRDVCLPQLAQLARDTLGLPPMSDAEAAEQFIARIRALCQELSIPNNLAALGVQRGQLDALVVGSRGNSMNGNPRQLTDPELHALLETLL